MSVPSYEAFQLPILKELDDGLYHNFKDLVKTLADKMSINEEDRVILLPSGTQTLLYNRIGWALQYLKKAGLIQSPNRGIYKLSEQGKKVLSDNPTEINSKFLYQFEGYRKFKTVKKKRKRKIEQTIINDEVTEKTPEELIEAGFQQIQESVASDILVAIKEASPAFFEKLVVDLMVKMGYGGIRDDAAEAIGHSGDGGVDGIIKEDMLGLDTIYLQAKRWDSTVVGRPEIQKFVGALTGKRARKGVFITTSKFSADARDYAKNIDYKVILIDGEELAELMIEHTVGVTLAKTFEVKRLDSDYFSEE